MDRNIAERQQTLGKGKAEESQLLIPTSCPSVGEGRGRLKGTSTQSPKQISLVLTGKAIHDPECGKQYEESDNKGSDIRQPGLED